MAFTVHSQCPDLSVRHTQRFDNVLQRVGCTYEMAKLCIPPRRRQQLVKFSVETEPDADASHCLYYLEWQFVPLGGGGSPVVGHATADIFYGF